MFELQMMYDISYPLTQPTTLALQNVPCDAYGCYLYQTALARFRRRQESDPADTRAVIGCLKCLDAMGEWGDVVELCNNSWETLIKPGTDDVHHQKAAAMAARYDRV